MKKYYLLILIQLSLSTGLSAQNYLSPTWKINFKDISETQIQQSNTSNWKDVNLLLSWERQNYSWQNGEGYIVNDFIIPDELTNSKFVLTTGLDCDIKSIYVNEKFIGGNIPNQFWTNRGARKEFILPDGLLEKKNRIVIFVSNLSYTGGISCNYCSISPIGIESTSEVKIEIPVKDHLYSVDESNSFNIKYIAANKGKIKLSIVNDFHESFLQKEYDVEKGMGNIRFDFRNVISKPGFYECVVIMNDGGYSSNVKWLALSPEKIKCSNNTIPGFKEYWNKVLDDLKKIAPEFKIKKVDSLSTGNRDMYIAEMKSLDGITIRGYYFVPKSPGKHAAVLHVPGYGYGWDYLDGFLASKDDVVELALCVRGHGISADVFNPGFGIPGVWGYKLCSETENAYRGIYMDCVRAVEFLLSRSEVDNSRIGVMGGSQGGGLTLVTAGLCSDKIKACSFFDPFPCDTRDHLKIRVMCNAEFDNFLKYYKNECTFQDALKVQDLLDTKGFAELIKCPTFFVSSLFDDDAPSHMGFSAYKRISASKSFKIYPELGHINDKTFGEQMLFLKDKLGF